MRLTSWIFFPCRKKIWFLALLLSLFLGNNAQSMEEEVESLERLRRATILPLMTQQLRDTQRQLEETRRKLNEVQEEQKRTQSQLEKAQKDVELFRRAMHLAQTRARLEGVRAEAAEEKLKIVSPILESFRKLRRFVKLRQKNFSI